MYKMYKFRPYFEIMLLSFQKDYLRIICLLHDILCFFAVLWDFEPKSDRIFWLRNNLHPIFLFRQTEFLPL